MSVAQKQSVLPDIFILKRLSEFSKCGNKHKNVLNVRQIYWVQWDRKGFMTDKDSTRCPHGGCILSFQRVERKSERSEFPLFLLLLFSLFRVWLPIWTIQDEPDETMTPHSLITQFTPCNTKQAPIWCTGELRGHSCLMFFIMKTPLLSNYAHRDYM